MATINLVVRDWPLDKFGRATILLEYSHQGDRCRINPEIKMRVGGFQRDYDVDADLYKLVSTKEINDSDKQSLSGHNQTIYQIQLKLKRIVKELTEKAIPLTAINVESEYYKDETVIVASEVKSVTEYYKQFIEVKEGEIGDGINSYKSTFEHFKVFTTGKGIIRFEDLNRKFLDGFRLYLDDLDLVGSTVHKQFKNFRIFLNWVNSEEEDNQSFKIPSAYKKMKIKARFGDPIGLTLDQFFELYLFDLSDHFELKRTRDLFVFGVSIGGPRHGDLQRIGNSLARRGFNVNKSCITYFEGKTGNPHQEIEVNEFGMSVLKSYPDAFPYVPSNQRMNTNLKSIARMLNWNEIKLIPEYNAFGKIVATHERSLQEIFSTKFMRKTAATIDNFLRVPVKTSMSRTGHKTFAAYSRYVDVNRDSLVDANQKWSDVFQTLLAPAGLVFAPLTDEFEEQLL